MQTSLLQDSRKAQRDRRANFRSWREAASPLDKRFYHKSERTRLPTRAGGKFVLHGHVYTPKSRRRRLGGREHRRGPHNANHLRRAHERPPDD